MELTTQTKPKYFRGERTSNNYLPMYSVFIALLPVIMMYKVPGFSVGMSTMLSCVFALYAILIMIIRQVHAVKAVPMLFFLLYASFKSTGNIENMVLMGVTFFNILVAASGWLNLKLMHKIVETVSIIAAICVFIQTFSHYIMGLDIPFLFRPLCIDSLGYYFTNLKDPIYRPSAFFLEPSHLAQYCIVGLISLLFPTNHKIRLNRALIISFGILLSTSGMGIALTIGVWGWFLIFNKSAKSFRGEKLLRFLGGLLGGFAILFVLMQFGFFSSAVQRVIGELDGYNAIWGRTLFWKDYFPTLSSTDLYFGKGFSELPGVYFTGFMTILYSYGLLGVILLYGALLLCQHNQGSRVRCMCLIYGSLIVVANLTGFISFGYWFGMIYADCAKMIKSRI